MSRKITLSFLAISFMIASLTLSACSGPDIAENLNNAVGEVQKKGEDLKASLNQKIGEAAAEAEKRFNEEKNRMIDEYVNNLGDSLKDGTEIDLNKQE